MVSKYRRPRNPGKTLFKKTRECLSVAQRAEGQDRHLCSVQVGEQGNDSTDLHPGQYGARSWGSNEKSKGMDSFPKLGGVLADLPPPPGPPNPPTTRVPTLSEDSEQQTHADPLASKEPSLPPGPPTFTLLRAVTSGRVFAASEAPQIPSQGGFHMASAPS